jgi:hypothetical protein
LEREKGQRVGNPEVQKTSYLLLLKRNDSPHKRAKISTAELAIRPVSKKANKP